MKYLVVMGAFYERDNNTPSEQVWAKITELNDEHEIEQLKEIYRKECLDNEAFDVFIDFYPLEELQDRWESVVEIW